MRLTLALLVVALLAGTATAAESAPSAPARTVPCDEIIDLTKFPYVGNREPKYRYRLVLGVVSVPPAYLEQVVPTQEQPWAYWRKAGLVVRAGGESITVSVPKAWRSRAGITWGNGGHGVMSSLRIAGCGSDRTVGNAYAGGFYLRSRSACVPLIFRVASRSATVRFGVGRRCG